MIKIAIGVALVGGFAWLVWAQTKKSAGGGVSLPNSPLQPTIVPKPTEFVTQRDDVRPTYNVNTYLPERDSY